MLRSEVRWWTRFLRMCECHLKWWMGPEDMDYEAMQQILQCEGRREVCTFLEHYKETAFTDLIQSKLLLAQFLVEREDRARRNQKWFRHLRE